MIDEPSDLPAEERRPCPSCGATHRTARGTGTLVLGTSLNARGEVERGLNDIRLAVLGVLATIGLTVGFGVAGPLWLRALAGLAAFAASAFLIWWKPTRTRLMAFMHRLTGH